jgi:ribosomal protein L37AE/L43A
MAQQAEIHRNAKGELVQCTHCAHIWLARSTTAILTCSVCGYHIVARDNIVTTDALNQNKVKVEGDKPPPSNLRLLQGRHQNSLTQFHQTKEVER